MSYQDDRNDNISGRSSRRKDEIHLIKQLPLIHLLERRGFRAEQRKLSSAVFPNLPGISGPVSVFLATRQRPHVWLAKYLDPDPMPGRPATVITRTLIDLWGSIYHHDKPVRSRYPYVMEELRQIAGLGGAGTPADPAGEEGPTTSAPTEQTGGDETLSPSPKLREAFRLADAWDKIDPRDGHPQDAEAGVFSGGDDDRREQMRDRFHELKARLAKMSPESREAKRARPALVAMADALKSGDERYFDTLAEAVFELTAGGK